MKKIALISSLVFSLFAAPAIFAEMVNINKADVATLDTLDGIGEKKAEAIVAYRTEHGEFKSLEEIKEVPGIGDGIYKKIEQEISLTEGAVTQVEAPAREAKATQGVAGEAGQEGKKAEATQKSDKVSGKTEAKAGKS